MDIIKEIQSLALVDFPLKYKPRHPKKENGNGIFSFLK